MTPLLLSLMLAPAPDDPPPRKAKTEEASVFERSGYYLTLSPLSFSFYEAKRPLLWGPTLGLGHAWGEGGTRIALGFHAQGLLLKRDGDDFLEQRYMAHLRPGRSGRNWFAYAVLGAGLSKSTSGIRGDQSTPSETLFATALAADVGAGASFLVATHLSLGLEWLTGLNFEPELFWSMTAQANLGVHW